MPTQIIPLKCPTCGNSCDVQAKDRHFGLQFKCGYCGTQSMLVINQQLYIPKPDERVCLKCGRVARYGARFCQCRALLLQTCNACGSEFPVGDRICDRCGVSGPMDESEFDDFLNDVLGQDPGDGGKK